MIFVFGSNLKGIHGAGAARFALEHRGAIMGQGEGLQGESYALPTCSKPGVPLPLEKIKHHVHHFLSFASRQGPHMQFQVTRIGCGIAGYADAQIAPFFLTADHNVWLPSEWMRAILTWREGQQP